MDLSPRRAHGAPRCLHGGAVVLVLRGRSDRFGLRLGAAGDGSPTDTNTPGPAPSVGVAAPSSPPIAAVVPPLDCTGDVTAADIDYVADASGGNRDLAAATRELRGVRWSDTVAVDGARSGVIRDGRGVFSGAWDQSTSGGWLMYQYEACVDDGVGSRPFGLRRDAVAEVVVDGGVRVRSLPTVDTASLSTSPSSCAGTGPSSLKARPGRRLRLVPHPGATSGGAGGPFGWVAAASRDGETWIDDVAETPCPSLPGDAWQFGGTAEEILLHCFGGSELAFGSMPTSTALRPMRSRSSRPGSATAAGT